MLMIRGERRDEEHRDENDYYCCERWSGTFFRSLAVPPDVDTANIQARFKNGVLEVRMPKKKEAMGRRIEVKAA